MNLKLHRGGTIALIVALVAVGACAEPTPVPTPGEALYLQYCEVCHGTDGASLPGMLSTPHLNHQNLLTAVDDAFLFENTARGRPGENGRGKPGTKMSAFGQAYGGPLADRDVNLIVAHIRSWQTEPTAFLPAYTASGDADAGAVLYYDNCESCHGRGGWGSVSGDITLAPALAGATFQQTASDAYIRHTVLQGRPGTTMPMFTLTDAEVGDLIVFIRSFYEADGSR